MGGADITRGKGETTMMTRTILLHHHGTGIIVGAEVVAGTDMNTGLRATVTNGEVAVEARTVTATAIGIEIDMSGVTGPSRDDFRLYRST